MAPLSQSLRRQVGNFSHLAAFRTVKRSFVVYCHYFLISKSIISIITQQKGQAASVNFCNLATLQAQSQFYESSDKYSSICLTNTRQLDMLLSGMDCKGKHKENYICWSLRCYLNANDVRGVYVIVRC